VSRNTTDRNFAGINLDFDRLLQGYMG
jgi:hypothetical protein